MRLFRVHLSSNATCRGSFGKERWFETHLCQRSHLLSLHAIVPSLQAPTPSWPRKPSNPVNRDRRGAEGRANPKFKFKFKRNQRKKEKKDKRICGVHLPVYRMCVLPARLTFVVSNLT